MPWALIIDAAIQLIMQCIENRQNRDDIYPQLRNPGIREAWALRQVIRDETAAEGRPLRGRALRHAVQEGMDHLSNMPDDGIVKLIEEAEGELQIQAEEAVAAAPVADPSVLTEA